MTACAVPNCQEPEEYVTDGMCALHRWHEARAVAEVDAIHADLMDEEYPLHLADRLERERAEAEERRREAFARIDTSQWADQDGSRYGLRALANEIGRLQRDGVPGGRQVALNRAAFSLGQLVSGGELRGGAVRDALRYCADAMGLPVRETRETIRAAMRAGEGKPRTAGTLGPTYRDRQGTRRAA